MAQLLVKLDVTTDRSCQTEAELASFGETVDVNGCSTSQTDGDQDMIPDNQDACPNTPAGEFVDSNGCSATQLDELLHSPLSIERHRDVPFAPW